LRRNGSDEIIRSFIQGGVDRPGAALEHVGVDHGSFYILVTEQFLHGANVITVLEKLGGKGIPKGRLRAA
jgi:hypothetical protein